MASVSVPVLLWQDYQNRFTAAPVAWNLRPSVWRLESEWYGAFDVTRRKVLQQIESFLNRVAKEPGGLQNTDFEDPLLFFVDVRVRPAYPGAICDHPSARTVDVRVPCVRGYRASGLLCCSLPTFGIGFHYNETADVKQMVAERVRQVLDGTSPTTVSRFLPPKSVAMEKVQAKLPPEKRGPGRWSPPLHVLELVAQPLGAARAKRSYTAAFEREAEMELLVAKMRARGGSTLLLGPAGVGKTTLIVNAVRTVENRRSARDEGPWAIGTVRNRFWGTNASRLIAGMKYLGEWQERCESVIEELSNIAGFLCLESLSELVRVGGDDPSASVAAFLTPYVQSGELRLICEATPTEFEAVRRLLPSFAGLFEIVRIDELRGPAVRSAVTRVATNISRDQHLEIDQGAVDATLRLFKRFLPYRPSPGGAVQFLRQLFDEVKRGGEMGITSEHVLMRFIEESGLPQWLLDDNVPLPFDDVLDWFTARIVGQDTACHRVAQLASAFKAGLNDAQRPISALLFCGPTGVGKTQLAKNLSSYLFGHGNEANRLVRLDMSEYAYPHQADRLITKTDGTPSDFMERVRRQPFVVVLLDEIEKAADNVFDVLLGLLDEGHLTDRFGRVTWFRSAVVIMTSNLGASTHTAIGFSDESSDVYEREVRSFFRPEFFNRLDGVVTFRALDRDTCAAITRLELKAIAKREGLETRRLSLDFTDAIVDWIVEQGFDARFGARPLQRVVQAQIVAPISRFLVQNPTLRDAGIRVDKRPHADLPAIQVKSE